MACAGWPGEGEKHTAHYWRVPTAGDDGLTCQRCGRKLGLPLPLDIETGILRARYEHQGDAEATAFEVAYLAMVTRYSPILEAGRKAAAETRAAEIVRQGRMGFKPGLIAYRYDMKVGEVETILRRGSV